MRPSVILALLPLAAAAPSGAKRAAPAPLLVPRDVSSVVPDKYIVKFKDGSPLSNLQEVIKSLTSGVDHVFENVFAGFSATLDKSTLELLRDHPDVEYIESDAVVTTDGVVTQSGSTWGLGRISSRQRGSRSYLYDESAGEGTCSYVIDTGIDDTHPDFGGRAKQIKTFLDATTDDEGHGTHVAGTIGSNTYGVAKKTLLYGVKVLDSEGQGSSSTIIAGMDFVAQDSRQRHCPKGALANMSLGGSYSRSLNEAAANLVNAGVFLGVAAGNENSDAADMSPASEPSVCTVGGSAVDDTRYKNSNWGAVVDIVAPAVAVQSLAPGGGTRWMTGTSMATPHVVGLAAYLAAHEGLTGTQALCDRMRALATRGAITNQRSDTVNLLVFNNAGR